MTGEKSSNVLLWLVAIGYFMQTLDTTIVNTALPSMAASLHESPLKMQAVVVSYTLVMAVMILVSGWLADKFGTRKVYLVSLFLFTVGSFFCAVSTTLTELVLSRVLQGLGGAMLQPVGRLAVLRAFPHERFLKAISFVTVPALIGPMLGPTLGGWLSQTFSWHWIFLINIPVGIAGFILSFFYMRDYRPAKTGAFDIVGFLLIALGMAIVSYALDGMVELGLRRATAILFTVVGMIFLVCYWLYASRKKETLFPLELFKVQTFRVGILGNFFSRLGSNGAPFLLPLFFQVGLGYSPLKSGLMMLPSALSSILMKKMGVDLINRIGYRATLVGNTIVLGVMLASFALLSDTTPLWVLFIQLFLFGGINSLQFSAMNSITLKDLSYTQASSGNSFLSMIMIFSMSLGVALAAALLAMFNDMTTTRHLTNSLTGFHWAFLCIGVISVITAIIFAQLPKHDKNEYDEKQEALTK